MKGQLSLLDIVKETKDKDTLTPEWVDCFKSCKNFTNTFSDGSKDTFYDGSPRCIYGMKMCGTSGKDLKSKSIDNMWHTWCKFYKPKDPT